MELNSETIKAFTSVLPQDLSREWVDGVWEQNFSEEVSLPEDERADIDSSSWKSVLDVSKKWLTACKLPNGRCEYNMEFYREWMKIYNPRPIVCSFLSIMPFSLR